MGHPRRLPVFSINGATTGIINLLFGRPLATSEERAEHIGPIAGIPIFGLDALSSAAYGPEAALDAADSAGSCGRALHRAGQHGHRGAAGHCVFQLPADDRGLSQGRRLLHRCHREPGPQCRAAGGRGPDDRLHSDGGGGHFGGRGRADFGRTQPAAAHARVVPGRAGDSHHRQYARRARYRRGVHDSHLSVRGDAADRDWRGRVEGAGAADMRIR